MSNTVALDFGRALFGPIGGSLFAFVVAFSCFGALNGNYLNKLNFGPDVVSVQQKSEGVQENEQRIQYFIAV